MYGINDFALREYRLKQQTRTPENAQALAREQRAIEAGKPLSRELATWYRRHYEANHPDRPKLASVRFLAIWHPVGSEIATPDGHWRRRRVEDIPEDRVSVIFRRNFRGS